MDIKAYLESGVLEQYVLGLLPEAEAAEVLRMAQQYPEIRAELMAMEHALEQYAQAKGIPMPEGLKERILDEVEQADSTPPPPSSAGSAPNSGRAAGFGPWMLALLLGMALAYSWWTGRQTSESLRAELQQVRTEKQDLQLDCNTQSERLEMLEQQVAVLRSSAYSNVRMQTVKPDVPAVASVFYNAEAQKAYLDFSELPELPTDKTYQLWALVDGQAVDMGIFDLSNAEDGFVEVPFIEGAGAFAVTVEAAGGVPQPTLEEMVVLGTLG